MFVFVEVLAQRARIIRTSGLLISNEIFVNGSGRRHDKSASTNFQLRMMSDSSASHVDQQLEPLLAGKSATIF